MKHIEPDIFRNCQPVPAAPEAAMTWRERLSAWWRRAGWNQATLPETLRADVEGDHPSARPVRGRAPWEQRL